jgi:hypothetical protein
MKASEQTSYPVRDYRVFLRLLGTAPNSPFLMQVRMMAGNQNPAFKGLLAAS